MAWRVRAMYLQIISVTLLLLHSTSTVEGGIQRNCENAHPGTITIFYQNTTSQFNSLQEALDFTVAANNSWSEATTVCLPPGYYELTKQIHFGELSLILIGSKNTSFIECSYEPPPLEEGIDYTWHFNHSNVLYLQHIKFNNCSYPFRAIALQNVSVQDCTFTYFSEAVFDIFNCEIVQLERSHFHYNRGTGILFEIVRGNTGAVALGYSQYPNFLNQPRVSISNCEFINNMALASSEFLTSERAVSNRVFTGRGGGIGIFIDESNQSVILDMIDCKLHGNFARSYGGGIYILLNGYGTQHVLTFTRVNIVRNTGGLGGAGVQLSYLSATDSYVPPHTAVFRECNFEDNIGEAGGGLYVFTSFIGAHGMYFRLDGCNFTGNRGPESVNEFGAAVVVSLFTIFQQRVTAERHDIVNCTFSGNTGRNGIVSIGYSPIRFSGTNNFINNSGASVRIVGSLVDFFGDLSFINNTDTVEGALSLLSFGQMRVNRGLHINFNGNKGRLGAAITVTTPGTSTAFLSLLYNSACFATYEDTLVTPTDWEDVNIDFQDNSAVLASALYLSRIGECSWFSQNPPYFRHTFLRDWPIWNFGNNTNTGYSDSHSVDHYVGTLATEITANIDEVTSWPGERYQMSISGIDEFNQVTSTNARLFQVTEDTPSIKFNPEIVVVAGSFANGLLTDEFPITYSLKYEEALLKLVNQSSLTIGMGEPFETLAISAENFTIRAEVCPGGYQLMSDNSASSQQIVTCQCLDIPEVVECEDDQDSVIIKDSYWAGYVEAGTPNLFFHPCPPGYCQCSLNSSLGPQKCVYTYTHSNQDLQCTPEREGILCGSCKAEYGVSALLNKCATCSNGYISLLVVLVFLEVCVLVLIVVIDRPISSWLYSFIFYVQIAPYMMGYFSESFQTVGIYVTYLQSALGMYFIYDFCLFNNLHPLLSYLLRYIPTISATIVFTSIWITRKSRCLKMKSLNHHGYWLIVILLYPQLVHTSISLLNCPQLPDSTGRTSAVSSNIRGSMPGNHTHQ